MYVKYKGIKKSHRVFHVKEHLPAADFTM